MELNSTTASPVLADPPPVIKSRRGIPSACLKSSTPLATSRIPTQRKKRGKLDDVRYNGWLDRMISSSPPRRRVLKDLRAEAGHDEADVEYVRWMTKYPSALTSCQYILNKARNKKIVVFLDYDGTLSPIVDDPNRAFMSDEMRAAVKNIALHFPTAIISGRNRDKVSELVGLSELYYAGSHGMDIAFPPKNEVSYINPDCIKSTDENGEEVCVFQPAREFIPLIKEVFEILTGKTQHIEGSSVENHKFCASVHYRNVVRKRWPWVAQIVHDVLKGYPRLVLTHGRKVLEVRPDIDWDKGKAVNFLLESLGLDDNEDVLALYIGDDRTDEDAFKVLRDGNRGYGILVSAAPKESKAFFSLYNTSQVKEFLESLVRMKKEGRMEF
ncbi:unnamed protein product [Cuscuta campestris]|uniref:Trehalose 6-phosphate phosphatase n=1 Tax=Cuscuta campestris TaxID=132261 RepID=A0A484NMA4_9ASTE|nr:unnamed protein product [Cuscuta campestris]